VAKRCGKCSGIRSDVLRHMDARRSLSGCAVSVSVSQATYQNSFGCYAELSENVKKLTDTKVSHIELNERFRPIEQK
jgi:hypothetical protein